VKGSGGRWRHFHRSAHTVARLALSLFFTSLSISFTVTRLALSRFSLLLCCLVLGFHFSYVACFHFSFISGTARRGQGELPWAAGGLREAAADGEQERTVYNIAMIQ